MNHDRSSHRRILRATSIIGGATLLSLIISLVRNKAVALIGGPEAVGLLGLLAAVMTTAGAIFTLGLDTSAVRQLAPKTEDPAASARVRWAIWSLAVPLAVVGAAAVWLFRRPLAALSIGDASYADEIGWLAIGVAATVVSATQIAIIQAYGRIGDIARIRVWSSLAATIVSVAAIYKLGTTGIVIAVLATPIVNLLMRSWFARGLPDLEGPRPTAGELALDWRALITIGGAVMAAQAVSNVAALTERAIITHQLGIGAAGLFHAAAAILWVNLTLLLNAMAADYYPRLSQAAAEPDSMNVIVNQQLHVMLVLAAPALVGVSVAAPLILQILYSGAFADATPLLRILAAGGVLRLLIFALGYVLLARGAGRSFLLGEVAGACTLPLAWLLIAQFGLVGAGVAVLFLSATSCTVYIVRARSLGVRFSDENMRFSAALFLFLVTLAVIFALNQWAGIALGVVVAAAVVWRSFGELRAILTR